MTIMHSCNSRTVRVRLVEKLLREATADVAALSSFQDQLYAYTTFCRLHAERALSKLRIVKKIL